LAIVTNKQNQGYPAACNQGMALARGAIVVLLNNDTLVGSEWLERLTKPLQDNRIGLTGPVSCDGPDWQTAGPMAYELDGFGAAAEQWAATHQWHREVEELIGFCLAIRRDVLGRIGGMDPAFGMGNYEDLDYCRRAVKAGFALAVADDVLVHHHGNATFKAQEIDYSRLLTLNHGVYDRKWRRLDRQADPDLFIPLCVTTPGPRPTLALCLMVRNEERFLDGCLESVKGLVNEVCVLDTGSTDGTLEIARKHGATLGHFPWIDDFAAARNASLALVKSDWVLMLDADERLEPDAKRIVELAIRDPDQLAYWVGIKSWYGTEAGQRFEISKSQRLFRNVPEARFDGALHEHFDPTFKAMTHGAEDLGVLLEHFGYLDSVIANQAKRQRNLQAALRLLDELPQSAYAHFNVGALSYGAGDLVRCEAECRESIRLWAVDREQNEFIVFCYTMLGRVCAQQGRVNEGLGILKDALRFNRHPELLYTTAETLIQVGEFDPAIALLGAAKVMARRMLRGEIAYGSLDPGLADSRSDTLLGSALLKVDRILEAQEHLEAALKAQTTPQAITLELPRCPEPARRRRALALAGAGSRRRP
jgi:GT2 family glycosyltransferase